jgi:hypothetical protein
MRTFILSLAALAVLSSAVAGQCPSNGLTLTFSGERLGDPFALNLYGSPGLSGLLAIDDTGGPVMTPIGPVCLGLTPNLQLLNFALDGSGAFNLGGLLPPNPLFTGMQAYLQAAAADAGQPGGFAVSNGLHLTLRPPRVFFFNPGYTSPFGTVSGSFCAYDALSDVAYTPAIPLPGAVLDAIMVPSLNWLAILLHTGTLLCYDANTMQPALSLPLTLTPGYPTKLYALHYGTAPSPFGGGSPGALRAYSLPTGTPGFTCLLSSGNPSAIMILAGTGAAYLRVGSNVVPISLVSGTELPAIALGGSAGAISDWVVGGTVLYCLMPGLPANPFGGTPIPPEVASVDMLNHVAIHTATALAVPSGPATMIRYGPGTFGNSVFVYCMNTTSPMLEVNPASLAIQSSIATSTLVTDMVLSPGGLEWLLLVGGGSPSLQTMVPPGLLLSQVTPLLPPTTTLLSIPNWTIRRGLMVYNNNVVLPFSTDYASAPFYTVILPLTSVGFSVVD